MGGTSLAYEISLTHFLPLAKYKMAGSGSGLSQTRVSAEDDPAMLLGQAGRTPFSDCVTQLNETIIGVTELHKKYKLLAISCILASAP